MINCPSCEKMMKAVRRPRKQGRKKPYWQLPCQCGFEFVGEDDGDVDFKNTNKYPPDRILALRRWRDVFRM